MTHTDDDTPPDDKTPTEYRGTDRAVPSPLDAKSEGGAIEIFGRFLLNLAIVAVFYFALTLGAFNLIAVLLIAGGVTLTPYVYGPLRRQFPWVFWVLLALGGVIILGGLIDLLAGGNGG